MKLPSGFDGYESDEIVITLADFDRMKAHIKLLMDQRDHARAWASFHAADAAWERARLGLLLKVRGIPDSLAPNPRGTIQPKIPAGLLPVASGGWNGAVPQWENDRADATGEAGD